MITDYGTVPVVHRLRKVANYLRMYGVRRTLAKVRAQKHLKVSSGFESDTWMNPQCATPELEGRNVGIVGCGNFAYGNIAYFLSMENRGFLRATCDVQPALAQSLCRDYGGVYATVSSSVILNDNDISLLYIATNHSTHAQLAIAALKAGKDVHIEKPIVTSREELRELVDTMSTYPTSKVFLGFNRPHAELFVKLKAILDRIQEPMTMSWFVIGHEIPPDHWYRSETEGGRVLGNLSHWTDACLNLVGWQNAFPVEVCALSGSINDPDMQVLLRFGDGSTASVTYTARGYVPDGVHETLHVQKGSTQVTLKDFDRLTLKAGFRRRIFRRWPRDHGHRRNIVRSYRAQSASASQGDSLQRLEAGELVVLAVRDALRTGHPVRVDYAGFSDGADQGYEVR